MFFQTFKDVINIFLLLLHLEKNERMKITGFVFAAGLGTRLYPLTAERPKALVKYQGKTLLDNALDKMMACGVTDVIVNVYHFPDMIKEAVRRHPLASRIRISDERAYLRDTAGGLKFAEPFWQGSDLILCYNVDILSNIDLTKLIDYHVRNCAEATLAVRNRQTQRYFLFGGEECVLCGWENIKTLEKIVVQEMNDSMRLAFSGIHVMNTNLARRIPSVEKSSVTRFYLDEAAGHRILGYVHNDDTWQDVGKFQEFHNLLS